MQTQVKRKTSGKHVFPWPAAEGRSGGRSSQTVLNKMENNLFCHPPRTCYSVVSERRLPAAHVPLPVCLMLFLSSISVPPLRAKCCMCRPELVTPASSNIYTWIRYIIWLLPVPLHMWHLHLRDVTSPEGKFFSLFYGEQKEEWRKKKLLVIPWYNIKENGEASNFPTTN